MSHRHILVVEGEQDAGTHSLARILEQNGYHVTAVTDTAAALEALYRNRDLELVILDIDLNDGMKGAESAESIQHLFDLPIVFTSSRTDPEYLQVIDGIPSYGFVPKQGGTAALLVSIRTALQLHETRKGLIQREQQLREGEERYRSFFHDSPIPMWEEDLTDVKQRVAQLGGLYGSGLNDYLVNHPEIVQELMSHSRVLDVNNAALELYGARSTEEFCNRYMELFTEQETSEKVHTLLSILQADASFNKEYRHRRFDGKKVDVSIHWAMSGYKSERFRLLLSVIDITAERKAQRALAYRARFERLLTALGSSFIHLEPRNIKPVIVDALGALGEFVGADRVYLFEYDYEAALIRNTHEWCASGVTTQIHNLKCLSMEKHADWVATHQAGKEIWIADVDALPETGVKHTLQRQGIKSVLTVPLLSDEGCFGFVGLDWVSECHQYSHDERTLLAGFAQMFSSFHLREQHAATQRNAHQQLLTVLDSIPAVVYVCDMQDYRVLYINGAARDVFGNIEGQLCWKALQSRTDGPCSFCSNKYLVDENGNPTGVYRQEVLNSKSGRYFDCMDRAIRWVDGKLVRLEIAVDIHDAVMAREELQRSKEQIDDLLQRNRLILREAHHRIKNNMAMVQGLLQLQADSSGSEEASQVLREASRRLIGMTALYEKLYRAEDQSELELDAYLCSLVEEIVQDFPSKVALSGDVNLCSDKLGAKVLSSLGILVNELLANSFKHAFVGRTTGAYYLQGNLLQDGSALELAYGDDGIGIPDETLVAARSSSGRHFGIELIYLLAEQLGAHVDVAVHNGTHYRFLIPL